MGQAGKSQLPPADCRSTVDVLWLGDVSLVVFGGALAGLLNAGDLVGCHDWLFSCNEPPRKSDPENMLCPFGCVF